MHMNLSTIWQSIAKQKHSKKRCDEFSNILSPRTDHVHVQIHCTSPQKIGFWFKKYILCMYVYMQWRCQDFSQRFKFWALNNNINIKRKNYTHRLLSLFHGIFIVIFRLYMNFQTPNLKFIWNHEGKTVDLNTRNSYQNNIVDLNLEIHMQIDQN